MNKSAKALIEFLCKSYILETRTVKTFAHFHRKTQKITKGGKEYEN